MIMFVRIRVPQKEKGLCHRIFNILNFFTVLVIAAICEWYVIVFRRDLRHIPLPVNRQLNLGKDRGHAARLVLLIFL